MDDYGAFSTHELWRPSIFTVNPDPDNNIFSGLPLDAISSFATKKTDGNLFDGLADDLGLPPLADIPLDAEVEQELSQDLRAKPELGDHELEQSGEFDLWSLDDEPSALSTEPLYHTWEAFEAKDDQPPHPAYFSEAGDRAFNALFQRREQSSGVIEHDATLQACCSLVLGRSSMFFQWDAAKRSFAPTLEHVSLSGVSLQGSQSLLEHFATAGAVFRGLTAFVTSSSRRDCTAMVALRRSVNAVLDHLERHVCGRIANITSLLHLQEVIDRPLLISKYTHTLLGKLGHASTDEELISMLSDEVTTLAESGSMLATLMEQILAHVSMPWLQRLAEDVGLSTGLRSHTIGPTVNGVASTAQESMPEVIFLAADDNHNLSSVKQSIRLLRHHVPDHPLVKPDASFDGVERLQAKTDMQSDSAVRRAGAYRNRMAESLAEYRQGVDSQHIATPEQSAEGHTPALDGSDPFALSALDDIGTLEREALHDPHTGRDPYRSLQCCLSLLLEDKGGSFNDNFAQNRTDVLGPLRPFIGVQAALVNGAVMGYLFNTYKLREHLDLHRSYHFFGNGDFATRLATALFSDDAQTAERKRGNIPTSEPMGLRLGSRDSQRWPPASSELRLTLLNVLIDSYVSDSSQQDRLQLPGRLSFAIRELTDAEIDRVMDPTSIYALDFLRLQYTPPSPLADIFTPAIVQHYDGVFRTLLVYVRVLHTTSQLAMLCHGQTQRIIASTSAHTITLRRFAWKSRHFATIVFSHFTDVVIAESWKSFSAQLDRLHPPAEHTQPDLKVQSADLRTVTRLHEACLDDIRGKLFLRHKHLKIRAVLDDLAGLVIKATATALHDGETQSAVADQERRFDVLTKELAALLEVLANKPTKEDRAGVYAQSAQSEGDAAKLLLARLSWRDEGSKV